MEDGAAAVADGRGQTARLRVDFDLAVAHVDEPVDGDAAAAVRPGHGAIVFDARIGHLDDQTDLGGAGMAPAVVGGLAPGHRDVRLGLAIAIGDADGLLDSDVPAGGEHGMDRAPAILSPLPDLTLHLSLMCEPLVNPSIEG